MSHPIEVGRGLGYLFKLCQNFFKFGSELPGSNLKGFAMWVEKWLNQLLLDPGHNPNKFKNLFGSPHIMTPTFERPRKTKLADLKVFFQTGTVTFGTTVSTKSFSSSDSSACS